MNPPRDKTAIAKTSGGVRRIMLKESLGSELSLLIIFIVYQYVCRSFITAELKEKYLEIPDFYSFSSIWPLTVTSKFDVPILQSVTYIAKRNNGAQEVNLYYQLFTFGKFFQL